MEGSGLASPRAPAESVPSAHRGGARTPQRGSLRARTDAAASLSAHSRESPPLRPATFLQGPLSLRLDRDAARRRHALRAERDWLMLTASRLATASFSLSVVALLHRPLNSSFPARSTIVSPPRRSLSFQSPVVSRFTSMDRMQCERDDTSFLLVLRVVLRSSPSCNIPLHSSSDMDRRTVFLSSAGKVSHTSPMGLFQRALHLHTQSCTGADDASLEKGSNTLSLCSCTIVAVIK